MDARERHQKELEAWRRRSAQRMRAGFLRGRVVVASILCFGLLWAVVFIQMATGNDPVLSAKAQAAQTKKRHHPRADRPAEVVEAPEPEPEAEALEPEAPEPEAELIEPEVAEEVEVIEEPETELEPLTTGQS